MARRCGGWVVVVALASFFAGSPGEARPITEPRNLLVITLDTLRADHLGVYRRGRDRESFTPAIDAFAERSVVFRDVTCAMPTTLPAHLTLFTGLAPDQHGVLQNGVEPRLGLGSVFERLAAEGHTTGAIVAARVLEARYLVGLGFDTIVDGDLTGSRHQLPGSVVVDRTEAWLETHDEAPFALWVHFFDPHEPYTPAPEVAARFVDPATRDERPDRMGIAELIALNDPENKAQLSDADQRHVQALYAAEVAELDAHLARLFAILEARGRLDDTLVVLVGDHGQALGEQGHWGHGEWLLEPIIKVPLIIRAPGARRGRTVKAPVEGLDLAPTLAELFGFSLPDDRRGRSLVPALAGKRLGAAGPRIVVRRRYANQPRRLGVVVLEGPLKWLYIREEEGQRYRVGRRDGDGGLDGEDFFDAHDPAARRFYHLVRGLDRPADTPDLDAETREMLRSLGYVL